MHRQPLKQLSCATAVVDSRLFCPSLECDVWSMNLDGEGVKTLVMHNVAHRRIESADFGYNLAKIHIKCVILAAVCEELVDVLHKV